MGVSRSGLRDNRLDVDLKGLIRRVDDVQRGHRWTAFLVGVVRKFADDRAGRLASVIAYHGFFSVFPLLLVFVSVTGFVLRGREDLQQRLLESALATFPIVGTEIAQSVHETTGSPLAIAVGLGLALWSGLAVVSATQGALNDVWGVSPDARPSLIPRLMRGLLMLVSFGIALTISAVLATFGSSGGWLSPAMKTASLIGSFAVNVALFLIAYRILTVVDVPILGRLPGAVVAGGGWTLLLTIGSWFVDRQVRGASDVYGVFAVVLGLLVWMNLGAQILLLGAEVNVVRARHLWPRSLVRASARSAAAGSGGGEPGDRGEVVDLPAADPRDRASDASRGRSSGPP